MNERLKSRYILYGLKATRVKHGLIQLT